MLEGVKDLIVNVNGKTIPFGDSYGGTVKVDLKNYQGALTNISGSNKIQASYAEKAKPQITATLTSIEADLLAQMIGAPKLDGGLYTNNVEKLPDVGVVFSALRFHTDKDRAFVFPRCNATFTTISLSTNTDSKKSMATVQIEFNALDSEKINASGGFMDVPSDDLSSVFTLLGWDKPAADGGDFNATSSTSDAHSGTLTPKGN